jgi:acetyl esterase/lipase
MARVYSDYTYGPSQKQKVDIHEPEDYNYENQSGNQPKGVILYIHGGGWQTGDKAYKLGIDPVCVGGTDNTFFYCSELADLGYIVISANYDLVGPLPTPPADPPLPDDPCPALRPRGNGYAPNNVLQIAELIKFLTVPGYATGINAPTWNLLNHYVRTCGLMIMGGSAGGHLTITGTFQAAQSTGYWPRGFLNQVGPMDVVLTPENPYGPVGQELVARYCQGLLSNQEFVSPWWMKNNYVTYPNFSALSDPNQRQIKTFIGFWYNLNDTLVPPTSIVRFRDWAQQTLGSAYVINTEVVEGVVIPGIEDHNVTSTFLEAFYPTVVKVFYTGLNYPSQSNKLVPTQGQIYPRPQIYQYPRQP